MKNTNVNSLIKILTILSVIVFILVIRLSKPWHYFSPLTTNVQTVKPTVTNRPAATQATTPSKSATIPPMIYNNPHTYEIKMLKDVGEAYMNHFGLKDNDFLLMQAAGINLIEGNFDICAGDNDVSYFLNQAQKYGIKVVLNAGAGEAEWGYACNQKTFPRTQSPVWQSAKVKAWVNKWKNHPAVYAWDTSNEAGSVFPNANWHNDENSKVPDALYLTAGQIQTAYREVKTADPEHPVMIRMNGWFFYDYDDNFFRAGNPFAKDAADIVMVNAYANVEDYYGDFVKTVLDRAISSIYHIDPGIKFIASLGTWHEPPLWVLHTPYKLQQDLLQLDRVGMPTGIAFFKYGAKGSEWYLPEDAPELWKVIAAY